MRLPARARVLLVLALAVAASCGVLGSIDVVTAQPHSSHDEISTVRAQDQAVMAPERRSGRPSDLSIATLGSVAAGLALLLLARRFAADRRYPRPDPIQQFASRSLRGPPRPALVPCRLVA